MDQNITLWHTRFILSAISEIVMSDFFIGISPAKENASLRKTQSLSLQG
jgi:hypothetical protein